MKMNEKLIPINYKTTRRVLQNKQKSFTIDKQIISWRSNLESNLESVES